MVTVPDELALSCSPEEEEPRRGRRKCRRTRKSKRRRVGRRRGHDWRTKRAYQ
jgi:hypothetical protein